MKHNITLPILPLIIFLVLLTGLFAWFWAGKLHSAQAQDAAASPAALSNTISSAFTYQGFLQQSGTPVDGVACDFYFALWTEITGGTQYGTQTINGVPVNEGVFAVQIDVGNVFTGNEVWLETAVQCPGDSGFTTLTPRQPITATPYALSLQPGAVISSTEPVGVSVYANDAPGQIALYAEADQTDSVAVYGNSEENTAVFGNSGTGRGVWGQSMHGEGVYGETFGITSAGVYGRATGNFSHGIVGESINGFGVRGISDDSYGVDGESYSNQPGVNGYNNQINGIGVRGQANKSGSVGVFGSNVNSTAVFGESTNGKAVWGQSSNDNGVFGSSAAANTAGVHGINDTASGIGVFGEANAAGGVGVYGRSVNNTAVYGNSTHSTAIWGESSNHYGVYGESYAGTYAGVVGVNNTTDGLGVRGESVGAGGVGVYGNNGGSNTGSWAGYFNGRVTVNGTLSKAGGSFTIDHPLDPANMVLQHSFVESPDMMNVYNGNITLDEAGEAWVVLPDWFEALNQDFRYQLTAVGAPGPDLYIAETVKDNQFKIAGGTAGMTVSWQITGIRHDPWAEANRIEVELQKDEVDQGLYLHPEAYGVPYEEGIAAWFDSGRMTEEE